MKSTSPHPTSAVVHRLSAVAPARPSPDPAPAGLRFGRIELDPAERQLRVDGSAVVLGARAFDMLVALAERAGQLVSKRELLDLVWPHAVVEENNLAAQVSQLRKVLGPRAIATIPGRGYRFIASASSAAAPGAAAGELLPFAGDPEPAAPSFKTNLAASLPALIGRDDELARLGTLVRRHRLVTLVGAGGVGKTRLAQALLHADRAPGHPYTHGVCWVELGAITEPAQLPALIAAALGVHPGAGEPLAGLVAAVAPLSMLIALDNAEWLLDAVAATVQAVHEGAPGVHVLVTSQSPLKLPAERVFRLGPLAVPDAPLPAAEAAGFGAVALFVERAQAADAHFVLCDADAPAAIRLCRELDGLPLAIELAAARAPVLGVQGLAASLNDRLSLLTSSGNRHAPRRQKTLRAALDWSHGFLGDAEQRVFRRLAVIAGSATLQLVQQVVVDPPGPSGIDAWAALDALEVLVDRSLVATVAGPATTAPRYRLLDSPRALAQEHLDAALERSAARANHALALAARFDAAWDERYSGRVGWDDWAAALEPDLDNAQAALAWARETGDAATAVAILPALLWALRQSTHTDRGACADACTALADACETLIDTAADPRLQWRAWIAVNLVWVKSRPERAHLAAQRALDAARAAGDRFGSYFALGRMAVAHSRRHDAAGCDSALAEMRAIEEPSWPAQRLVLRAAAEAYGHWRLDGGSGGSGESQDLIRRSLALYRDAGDGSGRVAGLIYAELGAGDPRATVTAGAALVARLRGTRQHHGLTCAQLSLGAAWLALGELDQARSVLQAGWLQAPQFELQAFFADHLALLAALEQRPRAAALIAGYADAGYQRLEELRQTHEIGAIARAVELARAALGDEAVFETLRADGGTLHDAQMATLAFSAHDA
ncbi:MAG: winged helix-turn-helix domain-containing protein [Pseudomonadota bacterium]